MPQQRLFVSESFTVLQNALVTAVQTLKAADALLPVTILGPHKFLAAHLRQAVAKAGSGYLGLHVFTLSEFAKNRAEHTLMQEERQPLSSLAASLVIKKLLADAGAQNYFSVLASHPGFLRHVVMTLQEFKQARISPQGLQIFLDRAHPTGVYQQRIKSLQELYTSYAQFLAAQHLYDDADILERAASVLKEHHETTPLLIYGFSDFSPLQQHVVEMAVRDRDTLVFFPWRPGGAYEAATASLGWLTSLGFHRTTLSAEGTSQKSLTQLQTRLFEPVSFLVDEKRQKYDHSVLLLSAPTVSREAREIARIIFTLVRERNLRFEEIAIFVPNLGIHGSLFYETLTALGVPCSFTAGLSLLQTRAGQSVSLLWRMLTEEYARTRVLEFLSVARPPFSGLLGTSATYAQLARWDLLSQEAGIVKGAKEWRTRLAQLQTRNIPDDTETRPQEFVDQHVLRTFIEFMEDFLANTEHLPRLNSWNGWEVQMRAVLSRYVSPSLYTDQVAAVFTRLGQLTLLDESVSLKEWGRIVTDALAATPVGLANDEPTSKVFVGDLASAQGMQFRAVIIPGMVEGQFPQTIRQDPLLFDSERQHLSEVLLCDLRQRNRVVEEERLAFASTLQSATEYVVFTYARQDQASGRVQVPSTYLLRVVEALSGQSVSLAELKDWCVHVPLSPLWSDPPATALDTIEFHWASVTRSQETDNSSLLGYLPGTAPFFSSALTAIHQRWDLPFLTAFDGVLTEETTTTKLNTYLFPERMLLSASALETYARCPFRYFLTAVLGLSVQDDPEQLLTIRPRDRGTLVHMILHDFFSRLQREHRLPVRSQPQEPLRHLLTEMADLHCAIFARTKVTGLPLLWELEQERIRAQLLLFLQWEYERDDTFVPVGFEIPFGREEASLEAPFFPAQLMSFVGDEADPIFLHGRIDRIDITSDGQQARILDYKSGKSIRGRFAGGTALQLPLYLFAARRLRPDLQWVGAEYVILRPAAVRRENTSTFSPNTWSEELEVLQTLVGALSHGIRTGCFPNTPNSCRPCPFPLVCGSQVEVHAARKQDDTRLAFLQKVKSTP